MASAPIARGGRVSPTISIPNIRHNGRNTLRACGTAPISAAISGSASTPASCEANPAALAGIRGNSQPNRRGRSCCGTIRRPPATRRRDGVRITGWPA